MIKKLKARWLKNFLKILEDLNVSQLLLDILRKSHILSEETVTLVAMINFSKVLLILISAKDQTI
jgi:hypothetical protein